MLSKAFQGEGAIGSSLSFQKSDRRSVKMPVVEVVVYGDGNPQAVESLKLRFELSIAEAKLVYPSSIRALLGDIADSLEAADLQESEDAVSDPEFVMTKVPLLSMNVQTLGEVEVYAKKGFRLSSKDIMSDEGLYRIVFGTGDAVFENHRLVLTADAERTRSLAFYYHIHGSQSSAAQGANI